MECQEEREGVKSPEAQCIKEEALCKQSSETLSILAANSIETDISITECACVSLFVYVCILYGVEWQESHKALKTIIGS